MRAIRKAKGGVVDNVMSEGPDGIYEAWFGVI
jgi:hypothetical protein